ncbi:MAG: FecR domain-containing protein [Niabella sp.]
MQNSGLNETVTHKGSKSRLLLPDGSTVVLNADSKISYSKDFNETSRNVTLCGEAYFEVSHNPERPFIVHTQKADIKVLGTAFNVRDYPGDTKFETSLIHGKVEVDMKGHKTKPIFLKPSEKLVVAKNKEADYHLTKITELDSVVAETSWVHDKLSFVDKSFISIASELERQFNVTIEFKNNTAAKYRYTGVFDDTRVEDILDILKIIKPFKYTVTENKITIY